jgi:glutaminyl-tRNA synthetase
VDTPKPAPHSEPARSNFIREIIDADLAAGRHQQIVTRFPPEPNGYLHIGHAKSICLNFGIARDYQGVCHLRFDDTNPTKEDIEYVNSIQNDIRWLGFDWGDKLFYASDYFGKLYDIAVYLIRQGKAYVDSLTLEQIRELRGTLTEPGKPSPYRDRSVEENLSLFAQMKAGVFKDGEHVLRAKIDMSAKNMLMRDPVLYRIRHAHHHHTGDAWCIYPMYDYAHPLSDAIEAITHSICTLEFDNNREFYDWVVEAARELLPSRPHQHEFARLNLAYTMMSKRNLLKLVEEKLVSGWDDPRMPTIAGLRRRGYTPEAIRAFSDMIGVAKANSQVDFEKLEFCIRDDLNHRAPRRMVVLDPLKVVITNYPEGQTELLDAADFPPDVDLPGSRQVPFSQEIYIERSDFAELPPKGFYRLFPKSEVRLSFAYLITCNKVIKDAKGNITELHCTYDPESKSGSGGGRKVKGVLHWVSAAHAVPVRVRLYDRLFNAEQPGSEHDFHADLNPKSLHQIERALAEPSLLDGSPKGRHFQFTRHGYFFSDPEDSREGALVFNRVVGLRDSWSKQAEAATEAPEPPKKTEVPTLRLDMRDAQKRPNKKTYAQLRAEARAQHPVLQERLNRYLGVLAFSAEDSDLLSGDVALSDFFEAALVDYNQAASVAKWVVNELLRETKEKPLSELPITPGALAELARLVDEKIISHGAGKEVFAKLVSEGKTPSFWVESLGLRRSSDDGALVQVIEKVLAQNADNVKRYHEGKKSLLGAFIGQVMREAGAGADPAQVKALLSKALGD